MEINHAKDIPQAFLLFILFSIGFSVSVIRLIEREFIILVLQALLFGLSYIYRRLTPDKSKIGEFAMLALSGTLSIYVTLIIFPNHPVSALLPEQLLLSLGHIFLFLFLMSFLYKIKSLTLSILFVVAAIAVLRFSFVEDWMATNDVWVYVVFGAPFVVLVKILFPIDELLR